jgi:hypothetical protein
MFAQPCTVLMLNNNTCIIVIDMTEKQDSVGIKGGIATDDNKKAKATAAIPMAVTLVAAALLLSGVFLISSYQPAIAQENMIGGGGGGSGDGDITTTDNATSTTITDGAAQGGNATNATTTAGVAGGNQSTSEVRLHIEEARTALQNNDTQGALMHLDLAFNALGASGNASDGGAQGNTTTNTNAIAGSNAITTGSEDAGIPPVGGTSAADDSDETEDDDASAGGNDNVDESNGNTDANTRETDTGEEEQDSECGGVTVGGTSAADDYGCPPDPDA